MKNYKRYYIERSHFFDYTPYDIELIKKVLQSFSCVVNVRLAKRWNNQPQVVCFSIYYPADCDSIFNRGQLETYLNKIQYKLNLAFNCSGLQSIFISEKDF